MYYTETTRQWVRCRENVSFSLSVSLLPPRPLAQASSIACPPLAAPCSLALPLSHEQPALTRPRSQLSPSPAPHPLAPGTSPTLSPLTQVRLTTGESHRPRATLPERQRKHTASSSVCSACSCESGGATAAGSAGRSHPGQRDLKHAALLLELGDRGVCVDSAWPRDRAELVELRHVQAEAGAGDVELDCFHRAELGHLDTQHQPAALRIGERVLRRALGRRRLGGRRFRRRRRGGGRQSGGRSGGQGGERGAGRRAGRRRCRRRARRRPAAGNAVEIGKGLATWIGREAAAGRGRTCNGRWVLQWGVVIGLYKRFVRDQLGPRDRCKLGRAVRCSKGRKGCKGL